jgi:hypothetical protein
MKNRLASVLVQLLGCLGAVGCATGPAQLHWRLDRADIVGGHAAEVLGGPLARVEGGRAALCFNGESDGLIVPVNPIEGWPRFTIEILFQPERGGPEEQRFLHIHDDAERRALIETRLTTPDTWALDTFLHSSATDRLTLLDRSLTQPTDRWYWAALSYDGERMTHYVNATKQLEGTVNLPPMSAGRISLGVRQNRVHWFKGCIAEVRFSAAALPPERLQKR